MLWPTAARGPTVALDLPGAWSFVLTAILPAGAPPTQGTRFEQTGPNQMMIGEKPIDPAIVEFLTTSTRLLGQVQCDTFPVNRWLK